MKKIDSTKEVTHKIPDDEDTPVPSQTPELSPDQLQGDHDEARSPPPNNQTQQLLDRGSFQPSACLSPRAQAVNKDFTFGTKIPTFSKSLN